MQRQYLPKISRPLIFILFGLFLLTLSACGPQPTSIPEVDLPSPTAQTLEPTSTMTPTPPPPRVLAVCMLQEPASLFVYNDSSTAARSVRQAIYDGPLDVLEYQLHPVLLESLPSIDSGDVTVGTVTVSPGEAIVDAAGELANLEPGVEYFPPGCKDAACIQTYEGDGELELDQMTVRYKLKPGLFWSDGSLLQAGDSQYAFEVARALFPRIRSALIQRTLNYTVVDDLTIQWIGIPGYLDASYATFFFTPMPKAVWSAYAPEELLTAEIVNRTPLGWGPYAIQEWTPGDHISMVKNPYYWRAAEGLPAFDRLVYRFMPNQEEALSALLAGECDLIDESAGLELLGAQLTDLEEQGRLVLSYDSGTAWEHLDFSLLPADPEKTSIFANADVRRAFAQCIDRQRLGEELFPVSARLMQSYVPEEHPLFNPEITRYAYDPEAAAGLLDVVGWIDLDGDLSTPRIAQGVSGIPEGSPLTVRFLTINMGEKERAAQIIQEALGACGIDVIIEYGDPNLIFEPGPEGPIFGRKFEMAQFAWATTFEPPCELYMSSQIPGPYPQSRQGWGGVNPSGYSNPQYDRACQAAMRTLPGDPEHALAHALAQSILAADIPVIPLYQRLRVVAARSDICNLVPDSSSSSALWNLEALDYGENCAN